MAAITQDNHGLRLVMRYVVLTLLAIVFIFPAAVHGHVDR